MEASSSNRFSFLSCTSRVHSVTATSFIESRTFTDRQSTYTRILVSFAASTISSYRQQRTEKTAVRFSSAIKHKEQFHLKRQVTWTVKEHSTREVINLFSIQPVLKYEKLSNQQPKILFRTPGNIMFFSQICVTRAWSGGLTGKNFFRTSGNKKFFSPVCSHVRGQAAGNGKSFFTFLATIRFFSSVCSHVRGYVSGLWKFFSTLMATIWFFSSVCSHVRGQVAWLGKSFSTLLATKRFFSSVCSRVHLQPAGLGKSFSTFQATIRLVSSMCSHMRG